MHEVHVCTVIDPVEQRHATQDVDAIPAHVRDLAARWTQPGHLTGHQAEPVAARTLVAVFEEQLVPQAHAEQRTPGLHDGAHRGGEPTLSQTLRCRAERAHTREHHTVARRQEGRIRGDHRLCAGTDKRSFHTAQVAHTVIAYGDAHAHRVPLVDGMAVPITLNASRLARPRALNAASAMWCRLSPRMQSRWIVAPALCA